MQTQARFVVGGAMSVAASVAVACAVALTHSAALADEAGVAIGEGAIVVPSQANATPKPVVSRPSAPTSTPVTVPAPEPRDVAVAPQADQIPDAERAAPSVSDEEALVREVQRTGSWERVREWARERGWDEARVRDFVERLRHRGHGEHFGGSHPGFGGSPPGFGGSHHNKDSAGDGGRSDDRHDRRLGSRQDQSRYSPDRRD